MQLNKAAKAPKITILPKNIVDNKGKWTKVSREEYHPFRDYNAKYNNRIITIYQ